MQWGMLTHGVRSQFIQQIGSWSSIILCILSFVFFGLLGGIIYLLTLFIVISPLARIIVGLGTNYIKDD